MEKLDSLYDHSKDSIKSKWDDMPRLHVALRLYDLVITLLQILDKLNNKKYYKKGLHY